MAEHYTRNTSGILKFCSTCGKMTLHKVSNKRVGSCLEVHVVGRSDKQKKKDAEKDPAPTLFDL